ncbi:MAG: hypothetical protein AAGG68_28115 [Bacteroidota bacterium]
MKKSPQILLLLAICMSSCINLFAQNQEENSLQHNFGIKAGWSQGLIYDQHTSPLLYQANMANIGLSYHREADLFFEVALRMRIGSNQSKAHGKRVATIYDPADIYGNIDSYEVEANPTISMMNADLRLRLLWSLNEQHRVGASLNVNQIMAGLGAGTWHYSQLDVAPEYQFTHQTDRADFHAAFSLPIAAVVVRPNWSHDASLPDVINYWWGFVKTNTQFTSLHQFFNPSLRLGTNWHLENGHDIGLNYFTSWRSYSNPIPMRMFEQGIEVAYFF